MPYILIYIYADDDVIKYIIIVSNDNDSCNEYY